MEQGVSDSEDTHAQMEKCDKKLVTLWERVERLREPEELEEQCENGGAGRM